MPKTRTSFNSETGRAAGKKGALPEVQAKKEQTKQNNKLIKGKCPNCENRFIATADDFIMTKNTKWGTLCPMIKCPYCHTYLYKTTGFFLETIWEEPSWEFKIVKESE